MSMLRMTAMPQLYISCWIRFSWEIIQCGCRVGICMLLLSKSFKRLSISVRTKILGCESVTWMYAVCVVCW